MPAEGRALASGVLVKEGRVVIDDESDNTEQDPGTSDPAISQGEEPRRHKVPTRGNTQFSFARVFGELGVFRLRNVQPGASFVSLAVKPVGRPDA